MARHIALLGSVGLVFAALTTTPVVADPPNLVVAQADGAPLVVRRHRPTRLTVYPSDRLYRQCVSWLELQHRPSGDVLYPQMNCHWAVRY
jgi:hypothetical protein